MFRIEIKRLVDRKWRGIPSDEIVNGKSILDYINAAEEKVVAAMYDDGEIIAYITNDDKYLEKYKLKTEGENVFVAKAAWLREIMVGSTESQLPLVAGIFPDSTITQIKADGNL